MIQGTSFISLSVLALLAVGTTDGYTASVPLTPSGSLKTNEHLFPTPPVQFSGGEGLQVTWEPEVANHILSQTTTKKPESDSPYMVAVVGIPGSGKSTGAEILSGLCQNCLCMPFDGYHFPLDTLKSFPNSEDYVYRRGAPDTFDVDALKNDLHRIKYNNEECLITLPGFCHEVGDPEYDAHCFDRNLHNVVVTEGLYLIHDEQGWEEVKDIFDLCIFVDADVDVCMDRLKVRNQKIPGYTPEEIAVRVDAVDRVNANIVDQSRRNAHHVVKSAAFR